MVLLFFFLPWTGKGLSSVPNSCAELEKKRLDDAGLSGGPRNHQASYQIELRLPMPLTLYEALDVDGGRGSVPTLVRPTWVECWFDGWHADEIRAGLEGHTHRVGSVSPP